MTFRGFLKLQCPVCDRAKVFRGYFDTPEVCPSCGFFFMRETGYFLPHVAIGYLATALAGVSVWLLLEYVIGVHSGAVIFVAIPVVTIGFGVWFSRYAKLIWLAVDLAIHPPTQEDFQARGREGGQRAPTTPSEGDDADA